MDFITLLTVIAFLLIAVDVSGRDRNPLVMLAGMTLLGIALLSRLFSGGGFFETIIPLFTDVGLSLLLAAAWLAVRKTRAKSGSFFLLGLASLGVAGLGYVGARLLGAPAAQASLLLELGPDDRIEEVAPVLARYGARYERAFPTVSLEADEDLAQVYLVYGDPASFEALTAALRQDAENVDDVALNRTVALYPPVASSPAGATVERRFLENDPLVAEQWGLEAIRGHEAHALLRPMQPARKAVVAIIDTGVDGRHEDVRGAFGKSPGNRDANGHGTHCAGIAGAVTNNGVGVASLNWEGRFVEVTGYPALGAGGAGTLESIAQAVIDAANDGADVISMSLGDVAPTPPRVLVEAVGFALRKGAIVAASAGNADEDAATHFPSNIEGVIAVAAVDQQLKKARFSNTIASLTRPLAAPGVDILSLSPNGTYKTMSGTSMATPVVAGLLGILRALNPELTAEAAYDLLHETGTTVEDSGQVGRVVNAEAAIEAVQAAL